MQARGLLHARFVQHTCNNHLPLGAASPPRTFGDQSVKNAQQEVSEAADGARAKWAQLKADAAAKRSEVKADLDKRTRHMDAKDAAIDADWAEANAAEALDFADWAVGNAQLSILNAIHARAYADNLKAADNLQTATAK